MRIENYEVDALTRNEKCETIVLTRIENYVTIRVHAYRKKSDY